VVVEVEVMILIVLCVLIRSDFGGALEDFADGEGGVVDTVVEDVKEASLDLDDVRISDVLVLEGLIAFVDARVTTDVITGSECGGPTASCLRTSGNVEVGECIVSPLF
jgi:hypothetical protein